MRRFRTVLMVGLAVATMAATVPAQAQFPFDPRALLGRMTAPFRHLLPHSSARHHSAGRTAARESESRSAAATEQDASNLGTVGPRTWPTAYEDVIGYTFWPQDFEAAFREHGFRDIVTAALTPAAPPRTAEARARRTETTGNAATETSAADDCAAGANARTDWPKAQLEQTLQLNETQRSALDRLQDAVNSTAKSVRTAMCDEAAAQTPPARVEALVQRLWAVQNAAVVMRGPLKDFYDALSDDQKAKLRAPADNKQASAAANAPMGRAGSCAQPDDRLMKEINQTVRPTEQQKASVEALAKTSGGMGQYLMAFCAQPTAADPLARLDAVNGRLTAINYAATSMDVALNQFSSGLSDEQRKRFDAMGR